MPAWLAISVVFFLLADATVPRVYYLRPPAKERPVFASSDEIPLFPNSSPSGDQQSPTPSGPKSPTLQDASKLNLIRYVSGEFAKATKSLPAGKEGFLVFVGKPVDPDMLERAVATHGAAVRSGDNVQISRLEFRDHQIVVDFNGGGRGKKRWRDRFHLEVGGLPTATTTSTTPQDTGPPGMQPGMGSTVYLEFTKTIPDLTPEDLKKLLTPFLDFTKQRSAAVQWFDTLPPDVKKAITDRHAIPGMDREMVVAAVCRPDHKVRERDSEGNDIEDWIYGQPPSKTVFIRFTGEHVTSIKQFPQ
jgi:hypothetical protein